MNQALKHKEKNYSPVRLLGYTLEEFVIYIENKFSETMNWNNYGSYWHLDHIKPLYLFDLQNENEYEYATACNYKNYQPLEAIENLKKNKYYVPNC